MGIETSEKGRNESENIIRIRMQDSGGSRHLVHHKTNLCYLETFCIGLHHYIVCRSAISGLLMIIGTGLRAALKLSTKLRRTSRMFPGIERFRHKCTLLLVPVLAYMGLRWKLFIPNCWVWLKRLWRLIMPSDPSPDSLPRGEVESPESILSVKVEVPVLRSFDVEDTDEYYCMYDSTWEDHPNEETSERRTQHSKKFKRFRSAARDMQKYRRDYPEQRSNLYFGGQQQDDMPNLQFYRGHIPSSPDGVFIEDFHNKWHRKYSKLEEVHSYIQWLFPLQEPGMNYQAKELTKKEIKAFREDGTAKQRLVTSYKLMLDFYGIELSNDITGEVKRANNWRERFDNLERNTHNNLRITRILKCLGTLGFPHYQAPLVRFFLEQTLVKGKLYNVKESALNYFIFAVIDKQKRRNLVKYAYAHYEPKHEFVWCPKTIQSIFSEETFPDDKNPIDLKLVAIDDNTASYQSVSHDVNKDKPMDWSGMAGEVSDLMRLGLPNDARLTHDNMCDLSTSCTQRNKGTSQGSKTTGGRNQNTNADSSHEDLPVRQNDTAQSSYGASESGSSITTPYPSQHPTTDSPKRSDCRPSSEDSERITDDQRKRAADKPTEHKLHKRSRVSEGKTNTDHDVTKNKVAADKRAESEPSSIVLEGKTNANDHKSVVATDKKAESEPSSIVLEGKTNANDHKSVVATDKKAESGSGAMVGKTNTAAGKNNGAAESEPINDVSEGMTNANGHESTDAQPERDSGV